MSVSTWAQAAMATARTGDAAADAGAPETGPRDSFPLDRARRISYLDGRPSGYGEKVSRELPKLKLRVRFPLPAPTSRHAERPVAKLLYRRFAVRFICSKRDQSGLKRQRDRHHQDRDQQDNHLETGQPIQ